MNGLPIPYDQLERIATHGSPVLLRSVGRIWGLGIAEQDALARGRVPAWAIAVLAVSGGFVAGALVYRKWPGPVNKVLGGK